MTGDELKRVRLRNNLTQKRLGILLGYDEKIAERTVQYWESGKRKIPAEKFRPVAKVLRIPLDKVVP